MTSEEPVKSKASTTRGYTPLGWQTLLSPTESWCCSECGALVHDVDIHDTFHDRLYSVEADARRGSRAASYVLPIGGGH